MKSWAVILISILVFTGYSIPEAQAVQTKPPTTISWYAYFTSDESDQAVKDWAYSVGYQAGQTDQKLSGTQYDVAIIDFGQPWSQNGSYGTWSFNATYGRFLSVALIQEAAKQFARGYYVGSGSDTTSQMYVAIGTNNYGKYTTTEHGKAWAQLVKDVGSYLSSSNYGKQVKVRGASDIELGYSTASVAYAWVNGYASTWAYPYYLYNYGDAGGCPQSDTTSTAGKCNNGWTQDHVSYVSWRADPAMSFPEIYSTAGGNAKQWQQIALYTYLKYAQDMYISGPLSQSAACAQRGGCDGTNNTPDQAWSQLWTALNNDKNTAQNMSYSSDMKWRK